MRRIAYVAASSLLLFTVSCSSGKKDAEKVIEPVVSEVAPTATPVVYKELSGYFVKNLYEPTDVINLVTAINEDQFKTNFGIAKTMNNKIEPVNFETDMVIAVIHEQTDLQTEIKITKVELMGDVMNVYSSVIQGDKQSFKMMPLALFSVPKNVGAMHVELYVGEEKKGSGHLH